MIQASHPEQHATGNGSRGDVQERVAFTELITGPAFSFLPLQRPVPPAGRGVLFVQT